MFLRTTAVQPVRGLSTLMMENHGSQRVKSPSLSSSRFNPLVPRGCKVTPISRPVFDVENITFPGVMCCLAIPRMAR